MDGFDDLLSSSAAALEDNPFANPFDKARSSSPDPWSTFGQQQHDRGFHDESYASQFGEDSVRSGNDTEASGSATPAIDTAIGADNEEEHSEELPTQETPPSTAPEDVGSHGIDLQSPGFRESIAKDSSPTNSSDGTPPLSRRSSTGELIRSQETPSDLSTSKASTPPPQTLAATDQLQGSNISSHTPLLSQSNSFATPLDYPTHEATQSFASLALGGESSGGWQTEHVDYSRQNNESLNHGAPEVNETTKSEGGGSIEEKEQYASRSGSPSSLPLFTISVDDPQKVGDPIRPYILYTVHTKTTSSLFNKPSFSVLRRYSDFLWLYETLSMNNPGVIVPPVPEKSSFGRFANLFVQQRRLALEICIQKIANHPVLAKDHDLKMFLESDSFALDIKHRKLELAQERGGLMSSIGQTLAGPKFFEVDDWFDRKRAYLDGLESQLKGLVKSIDSVSKQRADLAIAIGEFALSIGELSESDLSKQLCHSLAVMSDVQKKAQDLQHTQAQEDTITFMATAEEYARIINSVRAAFASRVRCHAQWQSAEGELRRIKQAHEKARAQGRIPQERMGPSLAQIADAERRVLDAKHEFDKCSKLVKVELARFEEERINDFKTALEAFLEGMIERQKELIATWEDYQELLLKKINAKQYTASPDGNIST